MSSLPLGGSPPSPFAPGGRSGRPWVIYDHIEQLFDVRTLPSETTTIPEGIDVLMLVHPKNLGEQTLYAIDQFVLKGGRALIFVDPHAEADQPGLSQFGAGGGGAQRSSDLPALFDAWGVQMLPGKTPSGSSLPGSMIQSTMSRPNPTSRNPVLRSTNEPPATPLT